MWWSDNAEVLGFLSDRRQGSRWHRARLILIGDSNVGKTYLRHRLVQPDVDLRDVAQQQPIGSTDGIDVDYLDMPVTTLGGKQVFEQAAAGAAAASAPSLPLATVRCSIWDYGGQSVYYATHHTFAASECIYLACFNSRFVERNWFAKLNAFLQTSKMDYWLASLQAHAPGACVILVATQDDKYSAGAMSRVDAQWRQKICAALRELYPLLHIADCIAVSALHDARQDGRLQFTDRRVERELKPCIRQLLEERMPIVHAPYPPGLIRLATVLEQAALPRDSPLQLQPIVADDAVVRLIHGLRAGSPILSLDQFDALLVSLDLSPNFYRPVCFRVFHAAGLLLHFDVPALHSFVFRDPRWVADQMALLFTHVPEKQILTEGGDGIVHVSAVTALWKRAWNGPAAARPTEGVTLPGAEALSCSSGAAAASSVSSTAASAASVCHDPLNVDALLSLISCFRIGVRLTETTLMLPSKVPVPCHPHVRDCLLRLKNKAARGVSIAFSYSDGSPLPADFIQSEALFARLQVALYPLLQTVPFGSSKQRVSLWQQGLSVESVDGKGALLLDASRLTEHVLNVLFIGTACQAEAEDEGTIATIAHTINQLLQAHFPSHTGMMAQQQQSPASDATHRRVAIIARYRHMGSVQPCLTAIATQSHGMMRTADIEIDATADSLNSLLCGTPLEALLHLHEAMQTKVANVKAAMLGTVASQGATQHRSRLPLIYLKRVAKVIPTSAAATASSSAAAASSSSSSSVAAAVAVPAAATASAEPVVPAVTVRCVCEHPLRWHEYTPPSVSAHQALGAVGPFVEPAVPTDLIRTVLSGSTWLLPYLQSQLQAEEIKQLFLGEPKASRKRKDEQQAAAADSHGDVAEAEDSHMHADAPDLAVAEEATGVDAAASVFSPKRAKQVEDASAFAAAAAHLQSAAHEPATTITAPAPERRPAASYVQLLRNTTVLSCPLPVRVAKEDLVYFEELPFPFSVPAWLCPEHADIMRRVELAPSARAVKQAVAICADPQPAAAAAAVTAQVLFQQYATKQKLAMWGKATPADGSGSIVMPVPRAVQWEALSISGGDSHRTLLPDDDRHLAAVQQAFDVAHKLPALSLYRLRVTRGFMLHSDLTSNPSRNFYCQLNARSQEPFHMLRVVDYLRPPSEHTQGGTLPPEHPDLSTLEPAAYERRQQSMASLVCRPGFAADPHATGVLQVYHGCQDENGALDIARAGFANRRFVDDGYFGSGNYMTSYPAYAASYPLAHKTSAKPNANGEYCIIGSLAILGRVRPIVQDHVDYPVAAGGQCRFQGKPMDRGYDTHHVQVAAMDSYQAFDSQQHPPHALVDEIVCSKESQLMPNLLIYFTKEDRHDADPEVEPIQFEIAEDSEEKNNSSEEEIDDNKNDSSDGEESDNAEESMEEEAHSE